MNMLSDIITYIRRIIKSPSNAQITDALLIDYINRFWLMDVDARIQLFDLKTKYSFITTPGVDRYNMPLYDLQTEPGNQAIKLFPVYQGFTAPAYVNGVQVTLQTQKDIFFAGYSNIVQNFSVVATGNGGQVYSFKLPIGPNNSSPINPPINSLIRGHIDITGIIATGNNQDPPIVSTFNTSIPSTSVDSAVYITSTDMTGANVVVADSGQFLLGNVNFGLLMKPGKAPLGNLPLPGGYNSSATITGATQANPAVLTASNTFVVGQEVTITGVLGMTELNGNTYTIIAVSSTSITIDVDSTLFTPYVSGGIAVSNGNNLINYLTGEVEVIFPVAIPSGMNINAQVYFFASGLPRSILFYNNVLTLRMPPSQQYLVELDAYLSPAAFLNTGAAIPFGYMAEYIARGAARKIMSDTGDAEQLQFYEPLFREQEMLVWKRSQRIWTSTRVETIYSAGQNQGAGYNNFGGYY